MGNIWTRQNWMRSVWPRPCAAIRARPAHPAPMWPTGWRPTRARRKCSWSPSRARCPAAITRPSWPPRNTGRSTKVPACSCWTVCRPGRNAACWPSVWRHWCRQAVPLMMPPRPFWPITGTRTCCSRWNRWPTSPATAA